ncbi:MAG TPA: hypothetical protein PKD12_05720 [Nitrospira sp.]|mgnify:CR=1 FL=1|nr:hypothetical protein [Nitrospira sp.]
MLRYTMSLWLMLPFMILFPRPVQAEWVAIADRYQSHPLQIAYVDPSSIRREGNVVGLVALIDWKAMQGGRTPTRFYSTTLSKQIDCAGKLIRTLASTDYYGHMGTAEIIGGGRHSNEGQWLAIEPGTMNEGLWETACRKGQVRIF